MTRQKTISSLSIAAIALLAVAVPSFAQAQSDLDAQRPVATEASEQTNVSTTELIAVSNVRVATPAIAGVERTGVVNTTRTASPFRFSASAFKVQNNFTSAGSSHFVSPQVIFSNADPGDPTAKKQFRADAGESASGRKLVTFTPSRGLKAPDKVLP